jgi:hypothetical protein
VATNPQRPKPETIAAFDMAHPAVEVEAIKYTLVLPPDGRIKVVRLPRSATVLEALIAGQPFDPDINLEDWYITTAEEVELLDLDAPLDLLEDLHDLWFVHRPDAAPKPRPQPEPAPARVPEPPAPQ